MRMVALPGIELIFGDFDVLLLSAGLIIGMGD